MTNLLIKPKQKDDTLLEDIRQAKTDNDTFHIWWLGQSGYLVKWADKHLLIDPYLSDSLTKKYAETEKHHTRMTELVIDPARLDFIDVVTSSHNHTDHLDGETLIPLMKANPDMQMIIPEANREFVANRIKADASFPIGLNDGESVEVAGFRFTAIPAAHEEIERDEAGRCKFLGYVIQFGKWGIYHSGDTLWFDGMVEKLKPFGVDIAILPINGRDPKRKVAGNLNSEQAVELGKKINAKLVIPCHYDMFTFNTADPAEFAQIAERQGQPYKVLESGERLSSNSL